MCRRMALLESTVAALMTTMGGEQKQAARPNRDIGAKVRRSPLTNGAKAQAAKPANRLTGQARRKL